MLTDLEKEFLHRIARTTIEAEVRGDRLPEWNPDSEVLRGHRGAFVTLKKHGHLRGCIGYIQAVKPLYTTIQEMALAAAFQDPRFPQLKAEELKDVGIEISVLTPLRELQDISDLEVGVHGLYIIKGVNAGLLLPQVASEYKWDPKTFLEETCRKAGLPPEAWKDKDAKIYIFSAEIF